MLIKIVYKLTVITSILLVIFLLPTLPIHAVTTYLRLVLIIILICEVTIVFKEMLFDAQVKDWLKNLGMVILSTFIILFLLESFFMFIPRSHGVGYTLACKLWFAKYWSPINSYDYRDVEPVKNKNINIFIIGDSFTAGHGIKKIKDRFSDVVKEKLLEKDKNIQVLNLSRDGFDTKSEYESMISFIKSSQIKPDFIVLQYCGNDIEQVAVNNGLKWVGPSPYQELNPAVRWVIRGSYLLNYFYWLFPRYDLGGYLKFLENAYSNETIFNEHVKDIKAFKDYADLVDAPLLVVIFPFWQDIDFSNKLYIDKLKLYFKDIGMNYIDVSLLSKDLILADRVVNINDGHASVKLNKLVGDEIYKYISKDIFEVKKSHD